MNERLSDLFAMVMDGYAALKEKPFILFMGCFSISFALIAVFGLIGDRLLHQGDRLGLDCFAATINVFCACTGGKDWMEMIKTPIENGQCLRVWRRNRAKKKEQP